MFHDYLVNVNPHFLYLGGVSRDPVDTFRCQVAWFALYSLNAFPQKLRNLKVTTLDDEEES